jgi:hypothetical protein
MGKANGKKNGKRQMSPNSLANLKPFEKGNKASVGHRRSLFKSLEVYFNKRTMIEQDGKRVEVDRNDALAALVGGAALRGPNHDTNDPNWRSCVQAIFDRLAPVPKEPAVIVGNVNVEQTNVAVSWIDQVREKAGRANVRT